MVDMVWTGFIASIAALLVLSRWRLWVSMVAAALVLAAFTLSVGETADSLYATLTDPGVILLALVVGLIPMIGGVLERSGRMDDLVENMRIGQKPFLASSPAIIGMLPMPGGALLSAPVVEKAGSGMSPSGKAAANVWFRHVLYLAYPLGTALIASAKIAGITVYQAIPWLFPGAVFMLVLGWLFLLRDADGKLGYTGDFQPRKLAAPLTVIALAPAMDFALQQVPGLEPRELATFLAVSLSFALALALSTLTMKDIASIGEKSRPWNFALIIVGMFIFLGVFVKSGAPEAMAGLDLPLVIICVVFGIVLGAVTGRIQMPASVIIPIYLSRTGTETMALLPFAIVFFAIYIGYVASPIHP